MFRSISPYHFAALAGTAILIIVVATLVLNQPVTAAQTLLLIFSGTLLAAPAISKFTFNKEGFVFETIAPDIVKLLEEHGQAIETINNNLTELSSTLKNIQAVAPTGKGGKEPVADLEFTIPDLDKKLAAITGALSANSVIIKQSSAATRRTKDLLNKWSASS